MSTAAIKGFKRHLLLRDPEMSAITVLYEAPWRITKKTASRVQALIVLYLSYLSKQEQQRR